MATHHPSPTGSMQLAQHQGPPNGPPGPQAMGPAPAQQGPWPPGPPSQQLVAMNEAVWMQIGSFLELLGSSNEATAAYDRALGHVHEQQKDYDNAKLTYRRVLDRDPNHASHINNLASSLMATYHPSPTGALYRMAPHHPSPTGNMQLAQHQGPPNGPLGPQAMSPAPAQQGPWPPGLPSQQLAAMREAVWMQIGRFLELLGTSDEAIAAYLPAGSTHLGRRAARRSSYHHALPSSKHLVIATGGTFNHLHSGHKRLLSTTALMLRSSTTTPSRIVVEIAADDLLKNNAYAEFANFESWKLREEAVARFLIKLLLYPGVSYKDGVERIERSPASGLEVITRLKQFAITIECIELHDHFGPTITDDTITALVVSRQEHHRGIAINTKRREIGCKPLEVIEVDSPDAKEAEATNQDDEEFNAAETLTFLSQGLPPAPSAPSLSSPVQPPLHIAPPPTALLPQPRSPFDAPPPPFTLQAPVPSALITLPAPVIPATPRLRPVRDIDIDMPPIQLPPLLLPLAPKLCAEHFYDAPRLEGIPTRERGREREDGGQGEREEQAEVLDVPGPDPQASPLGARTGRTALQEPVLQGRTPLPSAPRRMARQVAVEEVGESSRSGAERERMRRLVENEERNAREAEMEMEEIDMGSSSGASSGGERMGDRKGKGRAQEYNLATPPDSRPPSAGSVVEPVQSGSIPPHSPAPAASPSPPVRRPLPRVVNTHYPNRKPTCADFIRTALRLLNRHAQKRDIHRVVDRLCRNQGERLYKDQSIRKALCQQETGLRRRGDGWGLPEWGTEGGEVERRFGSGPGTSQARMSRMRRRP